MDVIKSCVLKKLKSGNIGVRKAILEYDTWSTVRFVAANLQFIRDFSRKRDGPSTLRSSLARQSGNRNRFQLKSR
ncbi:MAG: hypothetical protein QNJ84_14850 [Alphaproteobacteria bacterium]|nr:hypothetical protein [Alphaproteobacteria bacterium]